MPGEPNPFQFDSEKNPLDFEDTGPIQCPRCGLLVPRDEARLKVDDRLTDPGESLQTVREMKWVCPTCFKKLKEAQRGATLFTVLIFLVLALFVGLAYYFTLPRGR